MPAITVVLPKIVLELSFQKRLSSLWHVSYFLKKLVKYIESRIVLCDLTKKKVSSNHCVKIPEATVVMPKNRIGTIISEKIKLTVACKWTPIL